MPEHLGLVCTMLFFSQREEPLARLRVASGTKEKSQREEPELQIAVIRVRTPQLGSLASAVETVTALEVNGFPEKTGNKAASDTKQVCSLGFNFRGWKLLAPQPGCQKAQNEPDQ